MKKYIALLVGIVVVVFVASKNFTNVTGNTQPSATDTKETEKNEQLVSLTVTFPDETVTQDFNYQDGQTAYSVLKDFDKVTVQMKQYDFGVFVEKINDLESNLHDTWIYYINGESGKIAADQATLNPGDQIEWKYESITY